MSLYTSIANFKMTHISQSIMVVLHTSCILESSDDLKALASIKDVRFTVANSVFFELQVLKYSNNPKLKINADIIMQDICNFHALACDTEQLYDSAQAHTDPVTFHHGPIIFAFYDTGAAEEFVMHTITSRPNDIYIYLLDPYNYNRQYIVPQPLSAFAGVNFNNNPFRKVTSINCSEPCKTDPCFCENLQLGSMRPNDFTRIIDGTRFKLLTGGIGGEAQVFTSPELPDRAIKIYSAFSPSKAKVEKLENLIELGKRINSGSTAMPKELIYDKDNRCIGFTMKKISGEPLRNIILNEQWDKYDRTAIIKDLSLILLELRLYQINISDLSGNNILIGPNSEVYIIDCDSFETFKHPGGGATPPYGHPDITAALMFDHFREHYQINFAFSVLLFQCLLGWQNPLTQLNMSASDPTWRTAEFPYEANHNINAAPIKYQRWSDLKITTREAFADEFHFRRWHSIGAWIRALQM